MISVRIEAKGAMRLPYDPSHYLNALAPGRLPGLLKVIEPDAREVSMGAAPDSSVETHILNIRGAVAGLVLFDALYDVTYPLEPLPHVNVKLTSFANKNLSVIGQFFVQPVDTQLIPSSANGRAASAPEKQFMVLHVEEWSLRRWMILFALPLRIYLKWKVKTEVRRMGEFVAREQGGPPGEGVGFRMSTATITWISKTKA